MKRFIITNMFLMLLMGTVYSFSVFESSIQSEYQLNTVVSGFPYMFSLFFYALMMMLTGRLLNRFSVKGLFISGAFLWLSGLVSINLSTDFILFLIGYGVLLGSGIGVLYGLPLFIVQKTSKHAGFITGLFY